VLQTYQPEHYAIQAAAEHDYAQFYLDEIRFRTKHGLPPFRRLAKLVFADTDRLRAEKEALDLANKLKWRAYELRLDATEIIGPVPPFFSRVDRRYRQQILIRSTNPIRLLEDVPIPPRWIVDIDPVSTL
jgi:primosomal protein N' (replication factor Y)